MAREEAAKQKKGHGKERAALRNRTRGGQRRIKGDVGGETLRNGGERECDPRTKTEEQSRSKSPLPQGSVPN